MLFADTFSVPAATARATPVSRTLQLAHGILYLVEIAFLDGPEDEVNVVLRRALHQVVPTSPDATVVGNAATVAAHLWEPVEEPPFELTIEAWSPNATYAHEVAVRAHILPREILQPPIPELGIISRLGKLLFGQK